MSFDRRGSAATTGRSQGLTIAALVVVIGAVVLDFEWLWGLLFLTWSVPSLFSGVTYLVQPISRDENPWMFWIVVLLWLGSSVAMIAWEIYEQFG